jgi:hypothetical protein
MHKRYNYARIFIFIFFKKIIFIKTIVYIFKNFHFHHGINFGSRSLQFHVRIVKDGKKL